MTPAWLLDAVAAVMLAVATLSAARLVAARPWRRDGVVTDTDVAHLLMAVAMAGMLTPGLRTLPDRAWAVAFGLLAAWFAVRVARDARRGGVRALAGAHCAPHLVHSASMLYMVIAMTATTPATGMSGMELAGKSAMSLRYPTLALLFAFILAGYSVWDLDQLSGRRYTLTPVRVSLAGTLAPAVPGLVPGEGAIGEGAPPTWGSHPPAGNRAFLLSPAVTVGCRIAMGVAMAFMLFIAI